MKKLYWRPQRVSRRILILIAAVSVAGMLSVESLKTEERQPYYAEKIYAARLARKAFDAIKEERVRRGIPIDPEVDPSSSGLIGELLSPVTTNPGHLPAKQTSVNPNFAAVLVHLLREAGTQEGDAVAVGLSGSFPAINICVLAAIQSVRAYPVVITSIGSSQWGANNPDFLWPTMESVLKGRRLIWHRSIAYSLGGINDRALGLSKEGRAILASAIAASGVSRIDEKTYAESVERRMAYYSENTGERKVAAYVNVGGGTTSVGTRVGKKMFNPGLNRYAPQGVSDIDSVMGRFAHEGVPVIHISRIDELATTYNLPLQPKVLPAIGAGNVFRKEVYQIWLVVVSLAVMIILLVTLVRMDWGHRILAGLRRDGGRGRPEQMV